MKLLRFLPLVAVLAVGCNSPTAQNADTPTDAPTTEAPAGTAAPSVEPTGPEQPAPPAKNNGTSITLPSLPIGGNADPSGAERQCVGVSWTGPPSFPSGLKISVTDVTAENEDGAFTVDKRSRCGDDDNCAHFTFSAERLHCTVPVRATASEGRTAKLIIHGTVQCPAGQAKKCHDLEGPSQIGMTQPQPPETTTTTSS